MPSKTEIKKEKWSHNRGIKEIWIQRPSFFVVIIFQIIRGPTVIHKHMQIKEEGLQQYKIMFGTRDRLSQACLIRFLQKNLTK